MSNLPAVNPVASPIGEPLRPLRSELSCIKKIFECIKNFFQWIFSIFCGGFVADREKERLHTAFCADFVAGLGRESVKPPWVEFVDDLLNDPLLDRPLFDTPKALIKALSTSKPTNSQLLTEFLEFLATDKAVKPEFLVQMQETRDWLAALEKIGTEDGLELDKPDSPMSKLYTSIFTRVTELKSGESCIVPNAALDHCFFCRVSRRSESEYQLELLSREQNGNSVDSVNLATSFAPTAAEDINGIWIATLLRAKSPKEIQKIFGSSVEPSLNQMVCKVRSSAVALFFSLAKQHGYTDQSSYRRGKLRFKLDALLRTVEAARSDRRATSATVIAARRAIGHIGQTVATMLSNGELTKEECDWVAVQLKSGAEDLSKGEVPTSYAFLSSSSPVERSYSPPELSPVQFETASELVASREISQHTMETEQIYRKPPVAALTIASLTAICEAARSEKNLQLREQMLVDRCLQLPEDISLWRAISPTEIEGVSRQLTEIGKMIYGDGELPLPDRILALLKLERLVTGLACWNLDVTQVLVDDQKNIRHRGFLTDQSFTMTSWLLSSNSWYSPRSHPEEKTVKWLQRESGEWPWVASGIFSRDGTNATLSGLLRHATIGVASFWSGADCPQKEDWGFFHQIPYLNTTDGTSRQSLLKSWIDLNFYRDFDLPNRYKKGIAMWGRPIDDPFLAGALAKSFYVSVEEEARGWAKSGESTHEIQDFLEHFLERDLLPYQDEILHRPLTIYQKAETRGEQLLDTEIGSPLLKLWTREEIRDLLLCLDQSAAASGYVQDPISSTRFLDLLGWIEKYSSRLNSPDLCNFIERLLSRRDFIANVFAADPNLFRFVQSFVTRQVDSFLEKGELAPALFLIRLQRIWRQVAPQLEDYSAEIQGWAKLSLDADSIWAPYRITLIAEQLADFEGREELTERELQELILLYSYYEQCLEDPSREDPVGRDRVRRLIQGWGPLFKEKFEASPTFLQNTLDSICSQFGLPIPATEWTGTFPEYCAGGAEFNLLTGRFVVQGSMIFPQELARDPLFQKFVSLNASIPVQSIVYKERKVFSFKDKEGLEARVEQRPDRLLCYRKNPDREQGWLLAIPFDSEQWRGLIPPSVTSPRLFQSVDYPNEVWIYNEGEAHPQFVYQMEFGWVGKAREEWRVESVEDRRPGMEKRGRWQMSYLEPELHQTFAQLTLFEEPKQIFLWASEGEVKQIELPRYGLRFIFEDGAFQCKGAPHEGYFLELHPSFEERRGLILGLVLKNGEGKSRLLFPKALGSFEDPHSKLKKPPREPLEAIMGAFAEIDQLTKDRQELLWYPADSAPAYWSLGETSETLPVAAWFTLFCHAIMSAAQPAADPFPIAATALRKLRAVNPQRGGLSDREILRMADAISDKAFLPNKEAYGLALQGLLVLREKCRPGLATKLDKKIAAIGAPFLSSGKHVRKALVALMPEQKLQLANALQRHAPEDFETHRLYFENSMVEIEENFNRDLIHFLESKLTQFTLPREKDHFPVKEQDEGLFLASTIERYFMVQERPEPFENLDQNLVDRSFAERMESYRKSQPPLHLIRDFGAIRNRLLVAKEQHRGWAEGLKRGIESKVALKESDLQQFAGYLRPLVWEELEVAFWKGTLESVLKGQGRSCSDISAQMTAYFRQKSLAQFANYILHALDEVEDDGCPIAGERIFQLLTRPRGYDTIKYREILALEHQLGILITREQLEIVSSLLNDPSLVRQAATGTGKSSVILPLVALLMPKGDNLVVLKLLDSLYEENSDALYRTAAAVLGRRVTPLRFSMKSALIYKVEQREESIFKQLYQEVLETIAERGFVVTDRRSQPLMQAKFIALLDKYGRGEEIFPMDVQHLYWLGKLLQLFRDRQQSIYDEYDSFLHAKEEIHLRLGSADEGRVPRYMWQQAIRIFDILIRDEQLGLLAHRQEYLEDEERSEVLKRAAQQLAEGNEDLENYFRGEDDSVLASFDANYSVEQRNQIVFTKEMLLRILPLTLAKGSQKKYIRSREGDQVDVIPCQALNQPREGSEIEAIEERLAYFIQDYYQNGLSFVYFEKWVRQRQEKGELAFFQSYFPGYPLETVDVSALYAAKAKDPELVRKFLLELLPNMSLGGRKVSADAHNDVSISRTAAGLSATQGCPQGLHRQFTTNRLQGKRDLIMEQLSSFCGHIAVPELLRCDLDNPKTLVPQFFEGAPGMSVLIDGGKMLRGVPSQEAARQMLDRAPNGVRAMGYFDLAGRFQLEGDQMVPLTDLGCYFPHAQSRGADKKLSSRNLALLTVNGKDPLEDLLQNMGRLRQQGEPALLAIHHSSQLKTVNDLIQSAIEVEELEKRDLLYRSKAQELRDILHRELLDSLLRLVTSDNIQRAARLLQNVNQQMALWISSSSEGIGDYYLQRGALEEELSAKAALQERQERFQTIADDLFLDRSAEQLSQLTYSDELEFPIRKNQNSLENQAEVEMETQLETQQESQVEVNVQVERTAQLQEDEIVYRKWQKDGAIGYAYRCLNPAYDKRLRLTENFCFHVAKGGRSPFIVAPDSEPSMGVKAHGNMQNRWRHLWIIKTDSTLYAVGMDQRDVRHAKDCRAYWDLGIPTFEAIYHLETNYLEVLKNTAQLDAAAVKLESNSLIAQARFEDGQFSKQSYHQREWNALAGWLQKQPDRAGLEAYFLREVLKSRPSDAAAYPFSELYGLFRELEGIAL